VARRDPQEKKALSYTRDRRNDYGENDKSSRKNIRRNKRLPNRADRRRERQVLATAAGLAVTPDMAERTETRLLAKKSMWSRRWWHKWPDAPLVDIVERKLRRRARAGMVEPSQVEVLIERIRHRVR
jgi:hypothetical protein